MPTLIGQLSVTRLRRPCHRVQRRQRLDRHRAHHLRRGVPHKGQKLTPRIGRLLAGKNIYPVDGRQRIRFGDLRAQFDGVVPGGQHQVGLRGRLLDDRQRLTQGAGCTIAVIQPQIALAGLRQIEQFSQRKSGQAASALHHGLDRRGGFVHLAIGRAGQLQGAAGQGRGRVQQPLVGLRLVWGRKHPRGADMQTDATVNAGLRSDAHICTLHGDGRHRAGVCTQVAVGRLEALIEAQTGVAGRCVIAECREEFGEQSQVRHGSLSLVAASRCRSISNGCVLRAPFRL